MPNHTRPVAEQYSPTADRSILVQSLCDCACGVDMAPAGYEVRVQSRRLASGPKGILQNVQGFSANVSERLGSCGCLVQGRRRWAIVTTVCWYTVREARGAGCRGGRGKRDRLDGVVLGTLTRFLKVKGSYTRRVSFTRCVRGSWYSDRHRHRTSQFTCVSQSPGFEASSLATGLG